MSGNKVHAFRTLFLGLLIFLLCGELYRFLLVHLSGLIQVRAGLLLLDRILYGLVYVGLGYLGFCFSGAGFVGSGKRIFGWRGVSGIRVFLTGCGVGLFCFVLLLVFTAILSEPERVAVESLPLLVSICISGLLTPVLEELFYRGLLQEYLFSAGLERGFCLFFQASCFGLVHLQSNPAVAPVLGLLGLCFGILYWRYGLLCSILAHGCYNTAILVYEVL